MMLTNLFFRLKILKKIAYWMGIGCTEPDWASHHTHPDWHYFLEPWGWGWLLNHYRQLYHWLHWSRPPDSPLLMGWSIREKVETALALVHDRSSNKYDDLFNRTKDSSSQIELIIILGCIQTDSTYWNHEVGCPPLPLGCQEFSKKLGLTCIICPGLYWYLKQHQQKFQDFWDWFKPGPRVFIL